MYGASETQLNTALNAYGLVFEGLFFELRRQAPCHHLLNAITLCSGAQQHASMCVVTMGSHSSSQLLCTVSSTLYDLASQLLFPLLLLCELCNGLDFRASDADERDKK